MNVVLSSEKLTKRFGGLTALQDVSLEVQEGAVKSIVGPNGAGKTTFFNLLTGLDRPTAGRVFCEGVDITSWSPQRRVQHARIGRTFQSVRLFGSLTVLENVMIGRHVCSRAGVVTSILKTPGVLREERHIRECALDALHFVGLQAKAHERAASLPYGEQRRLEIARAIAAEPRILLLDEPAAGLNDSEVAELRAMISGLRTAGLTILLIEHQMRLVMGVSDQVMVLNFGRVLAEGEPGEIQANEAVREAYLGA